MKLIDVNGSVVVASAWQIVLDGTFVDVLVSCFFFLFFFSTHTSSFCYWFNSLQWCHFRNMIRTMVQVIKFFEIMFYSNGKSFLGFSRVVKAFQPNVKKLFKSVWVRILLTLAKSFAIQNFDSMKNGFVCATNVTDQTKLILSCLKSIDYSFYFFNGQTNFLIQQFSCSFNILKVVVTLSVVLSNFLHPIQAFWVESKLVCK